MKISSQTIFHKFDSSSEEEDHKPFWPFPATMSILSGGDDDEDDNVRPKVSLDLPPMSKFAEKWRLAFVTSRYSRAFTTSTEKTNKLPTESPSYTSILIPDQAPSARSDQPSSFKMDQSQLTKLVKDKDLDHLRHFGGVNKVASALETDVNAGISGQPDDVSHRQRVFGINTYKQPAKGFFHFVLEASMDLKITILLVCATLWLGSGIKENGVKEGWCDAGSTFVMVLLMITMSAVSHHWQNRQFDELSPASGNILIDVLRKGWRQQVSIFEIVVGDVVCLKIGDRVPADGLFIEGQSLQVDESSMTGESDHVEVNSNQNPFLFSGTKVADGSARMLVTSVGMNTAWGEMTSSISRDSSEQTPLQARLNKLTSSIGKDKNGNQEFVVGQTTGHNIINSVVGIIADMVMIEVVTIPEGSPLAVTFAHAYSMKRMMADWVMVRRLSTCKTMGRVTIICNDKSGTLTMNQMKVTKFWIGLDSMEENKYSSVSKNVLDLIREGVALNTTGSFYRPSLGSEYEFLGSTTEKAIISWAVSQLSMDMEDMKKRCEVIQVEAFNLQKKRSSVLVMKSTDDTVHVHWKGAAEMVLVMCSSFYDRSGIAKDLDEDERMRFEQIIQGMAASSLRCIAFAHKQVPKEATKERKDGKKIQEDSLTLLGLVGIKDPCHAGVKSTVRACQDTGVNIKMITGDNIFTAKAFATECGILKPQDEAFIVEGAEFRSYTPEERLQRVEKIRVMARSSPFDKLLMVQCLKQKGHVVAVTGDDTNNAPALKEADIGISMGIQGTEVAKESLDIIIRDENFASVVRVLWWGRCVYENIQKFIQFQNTVNVVAHAINFVAAVSSGAVPLNAVHLMWVSLIIYMLGFLVLVTELPTRELMEKSLGYQTQPLVTNVMRWNLEATYQIAVLLTLQFKGESIFGVDEAGKRTLIFNVFILCQVFNEFDERNLEKKNVFEGIHKSKLFLGMVLVTVILQVAMVEFLKWFTDTERLSWGLWGTCVGISALSWPIGWAVKFIPVSDTSIFSYLRSKRSS
ncbi:putative calcium-transporting ATPase 13, plasma membrane-type isoform X2 [Eucalyptus grandis]|uniref:putative calcium-transporting ATPase 13, plasma membrane-type isoform X2 n=1 Tax=Eucalyptus grandis TaxID=71139 RepID=UPI00192EAF4D|nr:putative calcium-transporting ATPase 13, plasma membrane-type isoform X2 [Eucalyptus grandis]